MSGIITERRRNITGCVTQAAVVLVVFAVLSVALLRLGKVFEPQAETKAEAVAAEPTAQPPTAVPSSTPQPSPMYEVTADILKITVVSAAATDEYNARAVKLTQERADIVALATAQAPATAEAAQIERDAALVAVSDAHELAEQNRIIDRNKRYLFEFVIPGFCVAVVAGLVFAFAVRFGLVFFTFMERGEVEAVETVEPVRNPIIEVSANYGRTIRRYGEAPCSDEMLQHVARGIVVGKGLADVRWIGNGFTRGEWYALRQWLIDSGLAKWRLENAHNQGAELTSDGWALFRRIADEAPSPTDEIDEDDEY